MPSRSATLLAEVLRRAAESGLNLVGLAPVDDFDACQPPGRRARERLPACGTLLVVGSGGQAAATAPQGGAVETLVAWLRSRGHDCSALDPQRDPHCFAQMGELAGLGTVSPVVGQLLHPTFGLWIAIRAVVLVAGQPFGDAWSRPLQHFQPCATCDRPCIRGCPAHVYEADAHPQLERCGRHLHHGGCHDGCGALQACPVGAEYRYPSARRAQLQTASLAAMRRAYGLGVWRFLPRGLRERL